MTMLDFWALDGICTQENIQIEGLKLFKEFIIK